MKRIGAVLSLLLLATVISVLAFAPGRIERNLNRIDTVAAGGTADARAVALHASLFVADLHADSLMWARDFLQRGNRGHVDLPRLVEGNVALQVLTTVTRSPHGLNYESNAADARDDITLLALVQRWPPRTWDSLTERALYQAERLEGFVARSQGGLRVIRTRGDLESLIAQRGSGATTVGAVLGTEGSHALDGKLENIGRLHEAGFRIMGLQHFFDNALGGSLHGTSRAGLSEFGRAALAEMLRRGIVIDVAHSSPAVVEDVLAATDAPLLVSHTGTYGHCPGPRNIPDALMQRIAARGGLIGIGFWAEAICDASPAGIAAALDAAVALLGEDAVALGSDFDGAVTTTIDAAGMSAITAALLARGMDERRIAKLMGGNVRDFLLRSLPPAP